MGVARISEYSPNVEKVENHAKIGLWRKKFLRVKNIFLSYMVDNVPENPHWTYEAVIVLY